MGLLSALGRGGMRALKSGEMFGRIRPGFEEIRDLAARRVMSMNPEAAAMIRAARTPEEIDQILMQLDSMKPDVPRPDVSPYAPRDLRSPYGPRY